jgi:hypothetical protein
MTGTRATTTLRMFRPWRFAVALAAASALVSGCVLSAEGELPDVEVTERDVAIPAAPLEALEAGRDVAIAVSFRQKPARAGLAKSSFSEVRVLSVQIAAKSGVADLAFLKSLRVIATSPEATNMGLAPVEIARYERSDGSGGGTTLNIPSNPPADVTHLWRSTEIVFTLQAVGQMPTMAWTADVGMHFGATLTY